MENLSEKEIAKLIERRRRQILVNSVVYYRFGDNLVTDEQWTRWAVELEGLQQQHPDIADRVWYAEAFKDFDHSTGQNLPLDDPWAVNKAWQLLRYRQKADKMED